MYLIVETDNFGGDYPNERFLCGTDSRGLSLPLYYASKERAEKVAEMLNGPYAEHNQRWWKAVADGYVLVPGFEP